MIKLLSISASPVEISSTELLLKRVAGALKTGINDQVRHRLVTLNGLDITACQACGEDPSPEYCFIDDAMTALYREIESCDCLLFGTPIYFDTVSAQAKLFIDRCNCLRPAVFSLPPGGQRFVRRMHRVRPAAMVIVGGEKAWFEGARRTVAGFFKWLEFRNEGFLRYGSNDYNRSGTVAENPAVLAEADALGIKLAGLVGTGDYK